MRELLAGSLVVFALLAGACRGERAGPLSHGDLVFEVNRLDRPAGVTFDARRNRFLVSNIGGRAPDEDRNGFITAISADGQEVDPRAYTTASIGAELNSPKGMDIAGDVLYVADLDRVIGIDLETGRAVLDLKIPDARFLYDVEVTDGGAIYVSDTETQAIYRVHPGHGLATRLATEGELHAPAGLLDAGSHRLWVAASDGAVLMIGPDGTVETFVQDRRLVGIHGIQQLPDGSLLVANNRTGQLLRIDPQRQIQKLPIHSRSPGDFVIRDGLLVLPELGSDRVIALRVDQLMPPEESR